MKKNKLYAILTLVAVSASIIASFTIQASFFEENGVVYRIFFYHVPLAWVAFLAFFVVMVMSIQYLRKNQRKYDIYALASAEIGVMFAALTLITGSIWARATWGDWWRWQDLRLTTTLITWIIYVAYLTLRGSLESERKARLSAVYGIVAFISIPITYISIKFSVFHPRIISGGELNMTTGIAIGLVIGVISFTILFIYITKMRARTLKAKDAVKIFEKTRINKER